MKRAALAVLLVLAAFLPAIVHSTGSLSIPNNIAAEPGPNVAASKLDNNWDAIKTYVNAREITLDVLANRPAAGTAGRWYYANDSNTIGALYVDTGAAWQQVSTATATGINVVQGLVAANNSGTPTTKYDLTASLVALRDPATGALVVRSATATLTNDTTVSGPAANGRDRSRGFSDSDRFIHLYYIWNGTTLATLSSTCSTTNAGGGVCGSSGGPVLPTGYTSWAYAATVPWNGTFIPTRADSNRVCYTVASRTLSNGTATGETVVSVASQVSSNASAWLANVFQTAGTPMHFRVVTGREYYGPDPFAPPGGRAWTMTFPNVSQQFYYFGDANPGVYVDVTCYLIPNG